MTVLQIVPSMSNPNKSYEIRLGDDGVTYCTCRAWISKKTCKHLDVYHGSAVATVPKIKLKNAPISTGFEIRGNMNGIKYPCLVDIKYDGILAYVRYQEGMGLQFTTKEGTEFYAKITIFTENSPYIKHATFLAEWIHGDGKNGTLYDLMRNRALPAMPGCGLKI